VIALAPVCAALALGWGARRALRRGDAPAPAFVACLVTGAAALVAWMALLDAAGIRWSPVALLAPLPPALAIALAAGRRAPRLSRPDGWALAALAVVAARAAAVAAVPSFGWDFRYIWGLKARVFALAGCHDPAWLSWPGHGFAHPGYPPAWPDLVAAGVALGGDAGAVAAVWQAALVAALAAACWEITRGCPSPLRALAAAGAAWSPTLGDPIFSGYAEPLLALAAAAAVSALVRLHRGDGDPALLAAACAVLAAAKLEGAVLAAGVTAGAAVAGGARRALPAAAGTAAAVAAWQAAILAGVAPADASFALAGAALRANAAALPGAFVAAVLHNRLIGLVVLAWVPVLLAWWPRELRGVRVACGVWAAGVLAAYLTTTADLAWHVVNSAERVLAAPLPGVLAAAAAVRFSAPAAPGAPPSPGSSRGGSPSA